MDGEELAELRFERLAEAVLDFRVDATGLVVDTVEALVVLVVAGVETVVCVTVADADVAPVAEPLDVDDEHAVSGTRATATPARVTPSPRA